MKLAFLKKYSMMAHKHINHCSYRRHQYLQELVYHNRLTIDIDCKRIKRCGGKTDEMIRCRSPETVGGGLFMKVAKSSKSQHWRFAGIIVTVIVVFSLANERVGLFPPCWCSNNKSTFGIMQFATACNRQSTRNNSDSTTQLTWSNWKLHATFPSSRPQYQYNQHHGITSTWL